MAEINRSPSRAEGSDNNRASWAVLALTGVAAAFAVYRFGSSRRNGARRERRSLVTYLQEHLAGSDVAFAVVHRLRATHQGSEDGKLFDYLCKEIDEDRGLVRRLLESLGASTHSIKRVASHVSAALATAAAGGAPGELSLLRTLEALAIGIQGKRSMWRALQRIDDESLPANTTFVDLEAKAVRQWEAIEERRLALASRTFSGVTAS